MSRWFVRWVSLTLALVPAADADADTERADLPARLADADTTDGRIEGDLDVVAGLGAVVAHDGARGAAELRLRYMETAGVWATYEDAFGTANPGLSRVFAGGIELRPLFLARWVTGHESGVRWIDLVVDSVGFEVGAAFEQPYGPDGVHATFQASLGLELPLVGGASGPWIDLHAGGRWSDQTLGGAPVDGPTDREFFLSMTLAFHQVIAGHLADLHDRGPR
jgi:hypothetical protein